MSFFVVLAFFEFKATALPHLQHRAIINTVLSLCAATVMTFAWSSVLRGGKLVMEDIQNATLAGGVAVGCVADLAPGPGGALLIGCFAATVSCFGFKWLNPWLARKGYLYDTCGINNLHGMPGLIGGLSSVVVTGIAKQSTYGNDYYTLFPHGTAQFGYQFAAIGISLGIAIGSGAIFGFLASLLPAVVPPFHDIEGWEVPASHHVEETDSTPLSEFTDGR